MQPAADDAHLARSDGHTAVWQSSVPARGLDLESANGIPPQRAVFQPRHPGSFL
ncbi:hypothetical protein VTH82DRAFT_5557 [Thermothelomyces myriococcoides]